MTDTKHHPTPEPSIPSAPLESILCTEELQRRSSRPPDHEKENRALVKLVSALADSPRTIFQTLPETILEITQCDSAGLTMAFRSQASAKQNEGAMDAPGGLRHCLVSEAPNHRVEDGAQLLCVVVDDDESVRESLPDLLREFGFAALTFSSAQEFLSSGRVDETDCLILDVAMPGMSGPELLQELKRRSKDIPTIFITGRKDDAIRARVLHQGAVGFLLKPFSDLDLLAALKAALQGPSGPALDR